MKYWRRGFKKIFQKGNSNDKQWAKDYYLEEVDIFDEYLEMVLQYGFVTIFVSAFPLAPFCALINNLLESRCDARKLLIYYRRPVAVRVKGIGVWLTILDFVSKFAVFSNALIIAFTSEFIPHLVYRLTASPDYSLKGYTNHSLSYMNVSELDRLDKGPTLDSNVTYCRYKDYRYPPWEENKYKHTTTYWTVLAARLIFMVLFENIVIFLVLIIAWAIPDVPVKLKEKIRRETYIINNIIIEQARNTNKRQELPKSRNVPTSLPSTARHESEVRQRTLSNPKRQLSDPFPKIEESFNSVLSSAGPTTVNEKPKKKKGKLVSPKTDHDADLPVQDVPKKKKKVARAPSQAGRNSDSAPTSDEDGPKKKGNARQPSSDAPQAEQPSTSEEPPKKKKKKAKGTTDDPDQRSPSPPEPPPSPKRKKKQDYNK